MSKMNNWKFDQTPNTAAITTRQVLEENFPILVVTHYDDDHSWAFVCGTTNDEKDARVVSMKEILQRDPDLENISFLEPGYTARRDSKESNWVISPNSD